MKKIISIFSILFLGLGITESFSQTLRDHDYQKLTVNKPFIFFDAEQTGQTIEVTVPIRNSDVNDLSVRAISFKKEDSPFKMVSYPSVIRAGESANVTIAFQPQLFGSFRNQLLVYTDGYRKPLYLFLNGNLEVSPSNSASVLYPNPATHVVNIQYEPKGEARLEVFDNFGTSMLSQRFEKTLDVKNLRKGLYHLMISDGGEVIQIAFVKE